MNKARRATLNGIYDDIHNYTTQVAKALSFQAKLEEAQADLTAVKDDEQEAYDNLSDSLKESERGQASSDAIDELDNALSELADIVSAFEDLAEEKFDALLEHIDNAKGPA
jgi:uncharacterized phage infection (PIP) family protein YhgE